jgi:hypothetical protein
MVILLWILALGLTAGGAALLIGFMMRCRINEAISAEQTAILQVIGALEIHKRTFERAIRDARIEAKRRAFDEFLEEIHVEQRQYLRQSKRLFQNRKILVIEERILFRNLPLSKWVEHQITLEDNAPAAPMLPSPAMLES